MSAKWVEAAMSAKPDRPAKLEPRHLRSRVEKEPYWLWRRKKGRARSVRTVSGGGGPGTRKRR
jgi:hypothetical protein